MVDPFTAVVKELALFLNHFDYSQCVCILCYEILKHSEFYLHNSILWGFRESLMRVSTMSNIEIGLLLPEKVRIVIPVPSKA